MKKMVVLLVVVLVLVYNIGINVKAAVLKEENSGFSAEQYAAMEEEYVNEIRMILLEKGCKNAGITLTYITDGQGNRNYTLTFHHARLEKLADKEIALLTSRLQESAEKILLTEVLLRQL